MKNTFKRVCAALAVSAVAVSATAISASAISETYEAPDFPYDQYGITAEQVEGASVQPKISMSQITLTESQAKANPTQTVEMKVEGANKTYNSFGLHIAYDKNLTVCANEDDKFFTQGDATSQMLPGETNIGYSEADDANLLFVSAMAVGNVGKDGTMFTLDFTLPENFAVGDVYPIGFVYKNEEGTEDQFVKQPNDDDSKLMQAWLFTKGMTNGYIKIVADPEPETSTTTEATTTEATTTEATAAATSAAATSAAATSAAAATSGVNSAQTGVAGVGAAVAGLAVAVGTAFVLRKKED